MSHEQIDKYGYIFHAQRRDLDLSPEGHSTTADVRHRDKQFYRASESVTATASIIPI